MITYEQAFAATEFHISHDGLPCTVWHRAGQTNLGLAGQFIIPVEHDGEDGLIRCYHILDANAGDFHTPDGCPNIRSDDPPVPGQPVPSLSDQSEDGYDSRGYDADGYDRNGFNARGYDADGYDEDGLGADGYDRYGYDKDGYNREGYDRDATASDLDLSELWTGFTFSTWSTSTRQAEFRQHLREIVRDPDEIDNLAFCDNCNEPEWDGNMSSAQDGSVSICGSCWDDWATCASCEERYPAGDLTETLSGSDICDSCRDNCYSYCKECEGWYHDENSSDHSHNDGYGCCTSPQLKFAVRNDGCEPLANDTRITVTLPAGTISAEGLAAIRNYLLCQRHRENGEYLHQYTNLAYDLDKLGDQWQTRTGNFTRRLSRHAYQDHQIKVTQDVMSQVGVIARDHSTQVSVAIEVTRDLNMGASEFYHEDSCWWGSYGESRCALKTNGGLGLRSFDGYGNVSGRAWVLPLRRDERGKLVPTFDTMTPDAFVVFNGYGDLSGYAAPRILAHMAGWTYRKIGFSAEPMYVNAGGYLVAPEDIAEQYTDGSLDLDISQHSNLFERELISC